MRIFSTDHKVIGLQYALTSLTFLLIGFLLILALRWHLASPTDALPLVGKLLGETRAVEGILLPEFYLQLGAIPLDGWETYRLTGEPLKRLAGARPT